MKKKITSLALMLIVIFQVTASALTPSVYLDGEKMTFESDPYIKEERTMVPFRALFEAVGAHVAWDGDTKTVVALDINGDNVTSIVLQIGSDVAFVNDEKIKLDAPPEIKDDFTFVPLRFVMESLGADVDWDQTEYKAIIKTK